MRIVIQQTTIILDFNDEQEQSVKRPVLTPLSLLEKLKTEVEKGRDANLWTKDQHAAGPQSPPGPTDGRPRNPIFFV